MSDVQGLDAGRAVFLEEAAEILEQLEESLLELEEEPENIELVSSVFRALHTIKGSGAMFGFERVSSFTHEVETVFDQVRSGGMDASKELIDLTLKSRDIIRAMLQSEISGEAVSEEDAQRVVLALQKLSSSGQTSVAQQPIALQKDATDEELNEERMITWRIRFQPPQDVFSSGTDPVFLLEDLRELGECSIVAMNDQLPRLSELDPEACYIGWDVLLTTAKGKEAIEDVFIFVGEDSDLKIEIVERHDADDDEDAQEKMLRLGDILVMRGELTRDQLDEAITSQKRLGEILVERGLLSEDQVN
ncbi:MAG: Hpt domain-containing protein, partial [Desulfopila sp.]|nr:Hpt domain-containing protein [Desulfopila sp.]